MARIMDIRKCERLVRTGGRTVMDVNYSGKYFSMWVYAAGQEGGKEEHPTSVQLDTEMAKRLRAYLTDFLSD